MEQRKIIVPKLANLSFVNLALIQDINLKSLLNAYLQEKEKLQDPTSYLKSTPHLGKFSFVKKIFSTSTTTQVVPIPKKNTRPAPLIDEVTNTNTVSTNRRHSTPDLPAMPVDYIELKSSKSKVETILNLLCLLTEIELSKKPSLDFSLAIKGELQELYFWIKQNITDADKDALSEMISKGKKNKPETEKLVLLNMLFKGELLLSSMRYLAYSIYAAQYASKEKDEIKIKSTSELAVVKVELQELIRSYKECSPQENQSNSSALYQTMSDYQENSNNNSEIPKDKLPKKYELCKKIIDQSITLLNNQNIRSSNNKKYTAYLYLQILKYTLQLVDLEKSIELKSVRNLNKLITDILQAVNFEDLANMFLFGKFKGDYGVFEAGYVQQALDQYASQTTKFKKKSGKQEVDDEEKKYKVTKIRGGNNHIYRVEDTETKASIIIRPRKTHEEEIIANLTADDLRAQRLNSAPYQAIQFVLLAGAADDILFSGNNNQPNREFRRYEIAEALPGRNLEHKFKELHEAIATKNNPQLITDLQINFVWYAKQILRNVIDLKCRGLCYPDLKPANLLLDTNHMLKTSDWKTLIPYQTGIQAKKIQTTPGFTTQLSSQKVDDVTVYDLDKVIKENILFTLISMLTNRELPSLNVTVMTQKNFVEEILDLPLTVFEGERGKRIHQALESLFNQVFNPTKTNDDLGTVLNKLTQKPQNIIDDTLDPTSSPSMQDYSMLYASGGYRNR